jgi:hypothetical protein
MCPHQPKRNAKFSGSKYDPSVFHIVFKVVDVLNVPRIGGQNVVNTDKCVNYVPGDEK